MLYAKKSCQLLGKSKKAGICTALETCGYFNTDLLCDIVPVTDLFLWDIKDTNDSRHVANTGKSNAKILANLKKADDMGAVTRLRCIMISSVNMELKHYQKIAKIFMSLKNCEGVELIPYHSFGGAKEIQLGRTDSSRSDWIPDNKEILKVKNYLKQYTNILD